MMVNISVIINNVKKYSGALLGGGIVFNVNMIYVLYVYN